MVRSVPQGGLVMEELSKEFSGKVAFGKCNTEDNRLLAMQFNITAIPSIMLFSHGQLVEPDHRGVPKGGTTGKNCQEV